MVGPTGGPFTDLVVDGLDCLCDSLHIDDAGYISSHFLFF